MTILSNKAQCAKCKDIIESTHRHDWVSCSCGAIFVDGGKDYLRRGGNPEDFIELSERTEDPFLVCPPQPISTTDIAVAFLNETPPRGNWPHCSPGYGDGNETVGGDKIVRVETNMTHPHLPGDFIRRDKDGDLVLVQRQRYEAMTSTIKHLWDYWNACNPRESSLDDYQTNQIHVRIAALFNALKKEEKNGPSIL
jgi:hypothetical protein